MNIYIACALTHVPRNVFSEYAEFQHNLANAVKQLPGHHNVRYALINSDPQLAQKPIEERARLCYTWDREMVEESDLIIAEASFPSIGLGIELQVAANSDTPIIVCFRDYSVNRAEPVKYENPDHVLHELQIGEGFVSLMALGIPSILKVIRYQDSSEGIHLVTEGIRLFDRE